MLFIAPKLELVYPRLSVFKILWISLLLSEAGAIFTPGFE
jgi:hypothetical protein